MNQIEPFAICQENTSNGISAVINNIQRINFIFRYKLSEY